MSIMTSRNPIHVNTQNLDPLNYNPKDNVSGYSAVPRNMTGVAEVMKRAGYSTHFYGKCKLYATDTTTRRLIRGVGVCLRLGRGLWDGYYATLTARQRL